MSGDLKIQGVVEVSAEGVDQTFNRVGDAAGRMSNKIEASAEKASKAVDGIGSGANQNAEQFTRAEGKISASIKRATTNLEQLNKTASEKLEIQIATQGLDASKFELQLQKLRELENAQNGVSNSAQSLGKSMEYVGSIIAAGGSGFVYWIKGAIDAADSLNDLSKSTGIAVDTLSGLQLASRQSGAELEGTAQAINKLSVNIGSNAAKFAALGITAKEPIEAFKQLADIFSKIDDPQTRAALGAEALGKSWASTAPLLAEGGASIQKMVDKGILLSGVTQGLADDSDAFNDALEEMKAGIQGAANSIAGDLLPVMLAIAKGMDDVTDNAGEMSSSFSPVAETMRAVAVLGGNVAFVLRGIGTEFGGMAAQVASAMRGDFAAAKSIGEMMKADAEKSRASFDKWEAGVMSATKTLAKAKDETDKLSGAQQKAVAGFIAGNANSSKAIDQAKKDAETIANLRIAQMIRVSKEAEKELTVLEKQQDEYAKALQNALGPLEKQAAALELEVQNYGLTEAAIQSNIVTRMEEARVIADANGAWPEHLAYLDKEIELRKQIATASSQKAFLETNKKAAEESAKEWEEFSDDINRALTDALMHGFEDGKSFGQNFVDSLKNSLKTAALKIVVNMVTSTGGSLANAAINAVAGTSSANDGAGANYFGLANNANSVYSLYGAGTQFFTGASTGSSSAGLMYANGTQLVGGDGIGALYTANGGWAGVDAGTGAASGAVAGEGAGVTGGSSAAGTIAWVAAIVMGMYMSSQAWKAGIRWENYAKEPQSKYDLEVYLRAQKDKPMAALFGKDFVNSEFYAVMSGSALSAQIHYALQGALFGKNRVTGTSVKGAFSEAEQGFSGQQGVNYKKSGGLFSSSKEWTEWNAFPAEVDSAMDSIYRSTRNSFIMLGEVFEDTTLAEKIKGFIYSFSAGDFSADDVVTGLQSSMSAVLTPSVNAAMKAGESWSQALGRIMQETQAVSRIFDMMGKDLVETFGKNNADSILKASDNLVTLFGTIDSLNASFGAYYGNFYTAEEQTAQAWKDMGKAFDIIGLALPKTRQEFRSLVDGLDLTTVSGEVTFKRLMDLQSGFAALTPAMEDVAAATTEIIDAAGRKSWGDKLAVLTGQKTQTQVDRDNTLASTADTAVQSIMRLVFAQEDLATASEETATSIANAADAAAAAAIASAESAKQIAEAMRVATIASFDRTRASNDAYKSSIQAFSTSGLAAITEAVSLEKQRIGVIRSVAAESVASIKGVFSLLENQVSDLYGTVASTQAMQASEGSAFIASALQNALSSGYLPDQSALSSAISGARSGLDANNFATQFEADRAALVMAGQLSQLRAVAGQQLPAAEQAVKLADDQLKALDTSLTYYKKQLDSLNGIKEGTADLTGTVEEIGQSVIAKITAMNANFSSLSDALLNNIVTASKSGSISASDTTAELGKSGVAADKAALVGGSAVFTSSNGATLIDGVFRGTNGYQGSITDAKAIITEAFNGLSAKEFQSRAIGIGLSAAMIDYMYSFDAGWTNSWAKQNGLPAFAVGTNYVPQDMVAKIHEGEAIIPKAYNPALGNNNSRLEKLVEGLTAEVQRLQSIVDTGNKHASRTANAVNGNPEQPMLVETV